MSVSEVTARIQQIQAHFGQSAAPSVAAAPVARAGVLTGPAGSGNDFDAVLGSLRANASGASTWGSGQTAGQTGTVAGQQVVDEARRYLGVPYLWGGTDPDKGLDCSGLVQLVYRRFGIDLPRVSYQQATAGRPVAGLAEARPGDILAFDRPVDHVAIYVGDNKMIEAPRTGLDVRVTEVYETPTAIRRVLPDAPVGVAARAMAGSSALPAGTPYEGLFSQAAQRYGLSPTLLAAVARQESGFDAGAVSPAGAQGLMQLMPATAAGLGVRNPFDPAQAVDGAARLLRDLVSEFGRTDLALAAYNAGPGAVHRYGGIPPYAETRHYVPAVLAHQEALERA